MRLAVYTDYAYRREGDAVYAERAFALFLAGLADDLDELVLIGRLEPEPGRWHYRLPERVRFVALPHYASLAHPVSVVRAMGGSLARFWAALRGVDAVWVLGPHPLGVAFALVARARRRRVALGVRQDLPRYVRSRRPGRRSLALAADVLEGTWRLLARRLPVVVVGEELARGYRHGRRVLPIAVSLVEERDLVDADEAAARPWDGELRLLTVGRLDAEKNPLMLADVLARLDDRWRLVVCGEGPLRGALEERLTQLGVRDRADLRGYVPIDGGLLELYRGAHAFLHVSWTEGMPQVLLEAFAAGLPVVATAVGGVEAMAAGPAALVDPGDPDAPAGVLAELAEDPDRRRRMIAAGLERVREHTRQAESRRVLELLG